MKELDKITVQFIQFMNKYLTGSQLILALRILCITVIFLSFFIFFYKVRKNDVVKTAIANLYNRIDLKERSRQIQVQKKSILGFEDKEEEEKESFLKKLDKKLSYAGLKQLFPWLKTEIYIAIIVVSVGIMFLLALRVTSNFVVSLLAGVFTYLLFLAIRSFLSFRNFKQTEDELLNFLNILKSYSVSSDEILTTFYRVSRHMSNPLKRVLEECYYEGKMTGNENTAMIHMINKIEHPKFKEIIQNIRICGKYNADYGAVIANSKEIVQNYIESREEQKTINKGERINFYIILAGGALCLYVMGGMLEVNIWHELAYTTIGNVILSFFIIIIGLFFWNVVFFDKS